jgi:hypothetical protein
MCDAGPDRSIDELGLTADLPNEPWLYPGPFLPFSCVQKGNNLHPIADLSCQHLNLAGLEFVVATGSNASADVMRRKFENNGLSTAMAHIVGRLKGFASGHSAHVSKAGYIAAAPYPDDDSSAKIVVSAFSKEQITCLDATEPNYQRVTVQGSRLDLALSLPLPECVYIYLGNWGVIVNDDGIPVPLGTQQKIFDQVRAWGLLPAELAETEGVKEVTRALGGNEEWRKEVTAGLAAHAIGRARPCP